MLGLAALLSVLGIIGSFGVDRPTPRPGSTTTTAAHDSFRRAERADTNLTVPAPTPQPTAKLALISSRGYDSYGYHIVEGQVRNISDEALRNVAAVTTWYEREDGFITTDDALIDYNPILPGQTSPFKTMSTTNPAMEKYTVAFQRLMGGTIETEDRRKR